MGLLDGIVRWFVFGIIYGGFVRWFVFGIIYGGFVRRFVFGIIHGGFVIWYRLMVCVGDYSRWVCYMVSFDGLCLGRFMMVCVWDILYTYHIFIRFSGGKYILSFSPTLNTL